ncbi:hypothetical protein PR048_006902 [Dryococelus australis]|uniref:Uncharacterized protein n=1 Tax=Dryococelus australis TaxID=614101 RepID=A0ABQ9IC84_9NEOP|nr:hypothetical protein PR048_006902 [Dryococelus australis]
MKSCSGGFVDLNVKEHNMFFNDLVALCEEEDANLLKLPSYKLVTSFVPLRKSALQALAACHYIHSSREKIFGLLYKAMEVHNAELQQTGFQCMKKFIAGFQIDKEQVGGL